MAIRVVMCVSNQTLQCHQQYLCGVKLNYKLTTNPSCIFFPVKAFYYKVVDTVAEVVIMDTATTFKAEQCALVHSTRQATSGRGRSQCLYYQHDPTLEQSCILCGIHAVDSTISTTIVHL